MSGSVFALHEKLRGLRQHWIARKASWLLVGQGMNFFIQAAYFILLARLLGVTEYGIFAGAFSLVNIVAPYTKLGSNMIYMRYVTADRLKAAMYWGNALLITSGISIFIAVVFFFFGPAITHVNSRMIFLILVLGNCLFAQIAALASTVFQTVDKMRLTATLTFLNNLARLIILVVMEITMRHATALQWSVAVLVASTGASILAMIWVRSEVGPLAFSFELIRRHLVEGLGFSFAGTTQSVYNDVDKTMLSHYRMVVENGFYTLAYRIVDFATSPIAALDGAALPRYFRLSHESMSAVIRLAVKSAVTAALLGLVIAGGLRVTAPWVPRLVGRDFSGVLVALHWLCWIPLLRGVHYLTGSALTGSGHQNRRTGAQFLVAVLNFLLNLWWIPRYGWVGAAWSSVASDGTLATINTLLLFWVWRRIPSEGLTAKTLGLEPK
jgi:O-antigen/teichoic acid export membrane protein